MTDFTARRIMMVDTQVRPSDVTKFPIIAAMLDIPREAYVPKEKRDVAYVGDHIPLGGDRVLMEARTFAKMLDALDIQPSEMVLDLGCGYGYSTAIMARMADAVVAVEEDEVLAHEAQRILSSQGVDNAAVLYAGLCDGAPKHGPYDVIVAQGAVEIVPDILLNQLKDGGRICCIFMQGALGVVRIGYKKDGLVTWRDMFNATAPMLKGFTPEPKFLF